MTNDLVPDPSVLAHLPGAPFTQEEVDGAVAAVQGAARWHIAPEVTETVPFDVTRSDRRLRLPTRKLVAVNSVTNVETAEVVDPATYRVSHALARVKMRDYWPVGYEAIEVSMTHGYEECPIELYSVIAEAATMQRRDQNLRRFSIDDFSQTYTAGSSSSANPLSNAMILKRHSLPTVPRVG